MNKIKARLGAISPRRFAGLPAGVQTILLSDMPRLLNLAEAAQAYFEILDGRIVFGTRLHAAKTKVLEALEALADCLGSATSDELSPFNPSGKAEDVGEHAGADGAE